MIIRKTTESETSQILGVHRKAFGNSKGHEIAKLVYDLLGDHSSLPSLSLAAVKDDLIVGHILYTKITITGASEELPSRLLAPLAVLPEVQRKGIGSQLIKTGLHELQKSGVKLVFVLGHPDYYPRCGFRPAGVFGYEAPYHIPEEHSAAWMVQELHSGFIGRGQGKVLCAESLNRPEHWRE
jgi:predicted N-acetyltransferase YhbS